MAEPVIHFFPMFNAAAASSEFGRAVRESGAAHRIFAGSVRRSYRSRVGLFLVVLPRIAWFALRSASASLLLARPRPDVVVVTSDIEALVFALVRLVAGRRRRTRIAFSTFIYTSRRNPRIEALRRRYYRLVLGVVDVATVHSRLECTRYKALFAGVATRFVFVRYGLNIEGRERYIAAAHKPERPRLVSSGRSGRDYRTLVAAVAGLDAETRIVCDLASAVPEAAGMVVLADCHDDCLIREIASATAIVVPLAATDISAGQMVIVQAKALLRPLIVTDTPTVRDYVTDLHDGLLVPPGDAAALRAAIGRLLADPALRDRLAANAGASYARHHTTAAFVRHSIEAFLAPPPSPEEAHPGRI